MQELITGLPEGLDALALARLAEEATARASKGASAPTLLHIARDDRRLDDLEAALAFFAPKLRLVAFPAWDTVPYDRVSPRPDLIAKRISALARLCLGPARQPTIVLTTANAVLQRVPTAEFIRKALRQIAPGQRIDRGQLLQVFELAGYRRAGTVMEPGEYAVRGGIVDVFAAGRQNPVRLDFFDDTLESIKPFDVESQRTAKAAPVQKLIVMPMSEVAHGDAAIKRFRQRYVEAFGAVTGDDPLYEAVSAGQHAAGMEHWLPLFHERLETLLDYLPEAPISLDHAADDVLRQRLEQITEHHQARIDAKESRAFGAPPYNPVPVERMFVAAKEWHLALDARMVRRFSPFTLPPRPGETQRDLGGRPGRTFDPERNDASGPDLFSAVVGHVGGLLAKGKRVVVAAWTVGARERLAKALMDHGCRDIAKADSLPEVEALPGSKVALVVLGLERGFETSDLAVIGEQDILGDRMVRPRRRARKAADVITEATSLSAGDLVVHADHGIGRFEGLETITALGAQHDCLKLVYAGGDKLYLPVENIDLLSRFGSDEAGAQLDRLGGAAWQARKARLKQRLREIASELIKIAALRQLKEAPALEPSPDDFSAFVARFPYEETEDQLASIEATLADLAAGRPMDRLICGDVGFGKTEVAIRAAFVAALAGHQVAVVVPTTLLARQHFKTFSERFTGLPIRIGRASRLVPAKELAETRSELAAGKLDIVVGTHALLGKTIKFARLGLVVVDEEQHFGVAHKERLKQLREDVHVLTLTATPIPRTLQLALSGVRELSLITTPPIDRLAVRTYISPFDPVVIKDALKRERFRGGQSFYVCPKIADLDDVAEFLAEQVPELRVARAHGQLSATELEDVMTAFYDGQYDVLLSTAIVESGLDIPNANTMIVHRADMFGLAQLYQLRGRVGRSKTRAYAYFTMRPGKRLTEGAEKRLKVLQSLDTLGAGFSLASHDLDIRGAGNLLGDEQSGHIREVGFELYQSMLEEAIATLKDDVGGEVREQWSPQINLGASVLIPEAYVADLHLRLGLYRRLATLEAREELDAFAAELVDRFGVLPIEVVQLLDVMEIKGLCRRAMVGQVDAGPKGAVLAFRKGGFPNPQGLVGLIQGSKGMLKLGADQRLVLRADWSDTAQRLKGARGLVQMLAELADAPARRAA